MKSGQIIRIISNLYTVKIENETINCQARGLFRKEKITPLVGDLCEIDYKQRYIMKILPRKNSLERPMISNVDYALIVTAVVKPNLSPNLLDKMISVIVHNDIKPVLCFTKMDLLEDKSTVQPIIDYYKKIGIPTFYNTELEELKTFLREKVVVVTGQTGAGKSTLLNRLNPNLSLATSPISEALGRGVHTTRHVELFCIDGILLADTPGFSSLDLKNMNQEELKDSFLEFRNYDCKFRDCNHLKETVCGVKEAVNNGLIIPSRYESYVSFMKEVKEQ